MHKDYKTSLNLYVKLMRNVYLENAKDVGITSVA